MNCLVMLLRRFWVGKLKLLLAACAGQVEGKKAEWQGSQERRKLLRQTRDQRNKRTRRGYRPRITDEYRVGTHEAQLREDLAGAVERGTRWGNEEDGCSFSSREVVLVRPLFDVRSYTKLLRTLKKFGGPKVCRAQVRSCPEKGHPIMLYDPLRQSLYRLIHFFERMLGKICYIQKECPCPVRITSTSLAPSNREVKHCGQYRQVVARSRSLPHSP